MEYFYSPPPPGMGACLSQGTPSIKFAGTHLYTWVKRSTVRVKCLAQEHSAVLNNSRPGLKSEPLNPESSALKPRLHRRFLSRNSMQFLSRSELHQVSNMFETSPISQRQNRRRFTRVILKLRLRVRQKLPAPPRLPMLFKQWTK